VIRLILVLMFLEKEVPVYQLQKNSQSKINTFDIVTLLIVVYFVPTTWHLQVEDRNIQLLLKL